jgi:hypothetical protein
MGCLRFGFDLFWRPFSHVQALWQAPHPLALASTVTPVRQLLDVVHQTVQLPLRAHLVPSPKREAAQPLVMPQIGKHRLDRADALAVQLPPPRAVDGALHQLDGLIRAGLVLRKEAHLPHPGAFWVTQAVLAPLAWHAAGLAASEL